MTTTVKTPRPPLQARCPCGHPFVAQSRAALDAAKLDHIACPREAKA